MAEPIEKISKDAREIRELRAYVDDLLTVAKIPLSRVATESGASLQRLKAWIDGTGGESAVAPLLAWKAEIDVASAHASGFVMTPTAERIIKAFDRAREPRGGVAHADEEETQARGIALIFPAEQSPIQTARIDLWRFFLAGWLCGYSPGPARGRKMPLTGI